MISSLSYWAMAQTESGIVLKEVGLDSLKNVVERHTEYRLYYKVEQGTTPLKLSLVVDQEHLATKLSDALRGTGYTLSQVGEVFYVLQGPGIVTTLPDGFFLPLPKTETEATKDFSVTQQVADSEHKVYQIGNRDLSTKESTIQITGYIKNIDTDSPAAGVLVSAPDTKTTTLTDRQGFYSILLPVGRTELLCTGTGLEDIRIMLQIYAGGTLDIMMRDRSFLLKSVVVSAELNQHKRTTYIGVERLQVSKIRHIPTVFGETDLIKAILTLPGVKSVGESSGGFNVRGGATDQNLILFNGGTIYNPTHLFGLFSTFNPDLVNEMELYKSSIPAKYGGRISSVLEVNNREGSNKKIMGSAGIGLLASKVYVEGPIDKDKTTFIVGARSTYSNWMLGFLPENSGYRDGSASFSDVTASVYHKDERVGSLSLHGYFSTDQFSFSPDTSYRYGNLDLALKWRKLLSDKLSINLNGGYDRYHYAVEEKANPVEAYNMRFSLSQFYSKLIFDWQAASHHNLNYGADVTYYRFSPGELVPVGATSQVSKDLLNKEQGIEMALFVSDKWDISEKFSVDIGGRYTFYSALGPLSYYRYGGGDMDESSITDTVKAGVFVKPYHGPELRLSIRYSLNENLTFKAGINTMRQNIHMLSNTAAASPIDSWTLSNGNISPQTGWQVAAGIYKSFPKGALDFSIEGYYKEMFHYLDYKSGAVFTMNPHMEWDVLLTQGKAFGVELLLKKAIGKLNGWMAYTYSRTMLREERNKEVYQINHGNWYPAAYDKPHDVKIVVNYKFTHRYSISGNADYATGRPVTIPISMYHFVGGYRIEYSQRNAYRIPDYMRIDLAFNIEPNHYLKYWTHSMLTFGVYNVLGRKNPFSVYYTTSQGMKVQGYQLSIFGSPIPYINYSIKF